MLDKQETKKLSNVDDLLSMRTDESMEPVKGDLVGKIQPT